MEPDLVMQNGGISDHPRRHTADDKLKAWTAKVQQIAKDKGLAHVRISQHPQHKNTYVAEAWKTKPSSEGSPRFDFSAPQAKRQAANAEQVKAKGDAQLATAKPKG
jgi:hypothetical protein